MINLDAKLKLTKVLLERTAFLALKSKLKLDGENPRVKAGLKYVLHMTKEVKGLLSKAETAEEFEYIENLIKHKLFEDISGLTIYARQTDSKWILGITHPLMLAYQKIVTMKILLNNAVNKNQKIA